MARATALSAARLTAILGASALMLASCTTTATTQVVLPRVEGTPALSISVPLTQVGCTLNDVCLAVGSSATSAGLSAVGEFKTAHSPWIGLTLPTATPPVLSALACTGATCLIGGALDGADLLWSFSATTHAVTVAAAPPGGAGIDALGCNTLTCALIDTAAVGTTPRISFLASGVDTWSAPLTLSWAKGDAITTLACATTSDCVVSALDPQQSLVVEVTGDGGATWTARTTPSSWTTLSSLSCEGSHCVGLASTLGHSVLVHTTALARRWQSQNLPGEASSLACTNANTCLVVGKKAAGEAWLATISKSTTSAVELRYVPTPLLGAACGTKVCAAIGVTTLVALAMPLASSR